MLVAAFSLLALGVAAQGASAACTTTTTLRNQCCPAVPAHTQTTSVDCHGCAAITSVRTGPVCDIVCPTPRPIDPTATTTVAVCQSSPTCTITKVTQVPFGCTVTAPAATVTSYSDCSGCALTTSATNRFGVGPECVGGRKTVTSGTATVTSCAKSNY